MSQDKIIYFYRRIVDNLYLKPKSVMDLILHPKKYYNHESYYKEKQRKSNFGIWYDQLRQTVKYGYPNKFYFPYGFDVKDKKQMNAYFHYEPFMRLRDKRNKEKNTTIGVLRDKLLFGIFTEYFGIKSPKCVGISTPNGILDLSNKQTITIEEFVNKCEGGVFY